MLEFVFNSVLDSIGSEPRLESGRLSAGKRAFILYSMAHGPIVLVGGLASWPSRYRRLAQILREISGSEVHVAPITPFDWFLGRLRGYGQLVFEVASAVDKALLESDSGKAVLVGHSAGGIACRVYVGGDPPYGGRRYSGHRRVSHLITLGSPHVVADKRSLAPLAQVNDLFPGALHERAGLRYVSVAGGAADGKMSSRIRKRYERLIEDGQVAGDGVVPVESALLPGSETFFFDDLYHSEFFGRWYGSARETVERWWPEDLRVSGSLVGEHHT
jgi:pimeloyl-ACP methyl ester carboxylesterase